MLQDLANISPLLIVTFFGLLVLMAGVFSPKGTPKGWLGYLLVGGFALALLSLAWLWYQPEITFQTLSMAHALVIDSFGLALCAVILVGAIFTTLTAIPYLPEQDADHAEYYSLVAFATLGMMTVVLAADLLTLFVAIEVMSLAIYVLAGFKRQSPFAIESAMKYFVLGSFASALLLFGFAFVYGVTGQIHMAAVAEAFRADATLASSGLAQLALVLVVAAFGFKIAAVPFHMWTPDVYEGAPSTVSGFMATCVKTASFGALARVLLTCFGDDAFRHGAASWEVIVTAFAVLSMCAGNLMALAQTNLKRILAYSAIAHTGYLLLALLSVPTAPGGAVSMGDLGGGLILYLLAYTLANVAAFGVAAAVSGEDTEDISEPAWAGLARRSPILGVILAISVLSLLGIPVTAGFMGKLTIFGEVLGRPDSPYLWLIILAVINSVVSAWYYLRIILVAYMLLEAREIKLVRGRPLILATGLAAALTLAVGLLPSKALDASLKAGAGLSRTLTPAAVRVITPPTPAESHLRTTATAGDQGAR